MLYLRLPSTCAWLSHATNLHIHQRFNRGIVRGPAGSAQKPWVVFVQNGNFWRWSDYASPGLGVVQGRRECAFGSPSTEADCFHSWKVVAGPNWEIGGDPINVAQPFEE